ncbi:uncharacterized protein LOC144908570 [Branchiostoma floridae x Branchiostoma belcheri]
MSSGLLVAAACLSFLVGVLGRGGDIPRGDIADGERYGKLPPPEYYIRGEQRAITTAEPSTTPADLKLTRPTTPDGSNSTGTPVTPKGTSSSPDAPQSTSSNPDAPQGTSSSPEFSTDAPMSKDVTQNQNSADAAGLTSKESEEELLSVGSGKVSASSSLGKDAETYEMSNFAEPDSVAKYSAAKDSAAKDSAAKDSAANAAPDEAVSWDPESEGTTDDLSAGFADFPARDDPEPLRPNKTDGGSDTATDFLKWIKGGVKEGQKSQHDKAVAHGEGTLGVKASKYGGPAVFRGDTNLPKSGSSERQNISAETAEDEKPLTNMFNTYNTFNLKLPADGEGQEFIHGFSEHFSHFRSALEGIAANHTENLARLVERIETLESHSWELELELGDVRAENMQLKQQLEELAMECQNTNARLEEKTCQTGNETLRLKEELEEVKLRWAENVTRMEEECFRVTHNVSDVMFDMENRIREETNKNMSEVQDNIAWGCLAVQGECRSRMDNLTLEVRKVTDSNHVVRNDVPLQLTQADASTVYFPAFTPANARDCSELYRKGVWQSGVYRIQPDIADGGPVIEAFCDMDTESGGWTVIQRRPDWMGPLRFFNKNWTEYSRGFGDVRGEHWLGNEALHHLTSGRDNVLRIDMRSASTRWHASYSSFSVDQEDKDYRLSLSGFHGNAGDAMTQDAKVDHVPFTTADRDNDACADCNCAADFKGGWWYREPECEVGLNGEHGGVNYGWTSREIFLYPEFVEMKTRPRDFDKLVALSGLMAKDNHFVEEDSLETKEETKHVELP